MKAMSASETMVKESMTAASLKTARPAPNSELPLRSVVSNWAGLVANGVLSFVLTPLLVHALGDVPPLATAIAISPFFAQTAPPSGRADRKYFSQKLHGFARLWQTMRQFQ
jgi:hypothetical protein